MLFVDDYSGIMHVYGFIKQGKLFWFCMELTGTTHKESLPESDLLPVNLVAAATATLQ